jgi:hypothetical protein
MTDSTSNASRALQLPHGLKTDPGNRMPVFYTRSRGSPMVALNSASMPTNSDDAETSNTAIDVRLFLIF